MIEHTSCTVSSLASIGALAITAPEKAAVADRLARGLSKTPGKFGALPVVEVGKIGAHFLPLRTIVLIEKLKCSAKPFDVAKRTIRAGTDEQQLLQLRLFSLGRVASRARSTQLEDAS